MSSRRDLNVEDLQTIKEILAKRFALDGGSQVAIGGRHHPHIRLQRACSSQPLEFMFLQDAEEFGLRGQTHLADFVEKQRPACSQLDLTGLGLMRAGEGAALVAEEFGFEQLLGKRRAIQCDERAFAPRRGAMNEPRDDFFAGAGFPGQKDGGVGRRDLGRSA